MYFADYQIIISIYNYCHVLSKKLINFRTIHHSNNIFIILAIIISHNSIHLLPFLWAFRWSFVNSLLVTLTYLTIDCFPLLVTLTYSTIDCFSTPCDIDLLDHRWSTYSLSHWVTRPSCVNRLLVTLSNTTIVYPTPPNAMNCMPLSYLSVPVAVS